MPVSKIGPHIIRPTPAAMRWAQRAHIVKAMDTIAPFEVAKEHAIRIFRHHFGDQNLNRNPQHVAGEILEALKGYRHRNLVVEVYNEIPRTLTSAHASLLQEVVPLLKREGLRVGGPCWSTGDYELEDFEIMRARKWCGLDFLFLHAYWGMPYGLPVGEVFTPWNALRWRQWWKLGDPPVMVTETGRDMVRDGAGGVYVGRKGWKNDGLSDEEFLEELQHYDNLLNQNSWEWGATVFTAGPTDDWRAFDTDDISDRIIVNPKAPSWAVQTVERVTPVSPPPSNNPPLKRALLGGIQVYDLRDNFPYFNGREYRERDLTNITGVVMHHTATGEADTLESAQALLSAIHRWHTGQTPGSPNDWPAIGYHFAIDSSGRIYWLNGINLVSYHCGGTPVINGIGKGNWDNIGVAWLGNFTNREPNPVMVKSADALLTALEKELDKDLNLLGHKEIPGNSTICPGNHWPTTKSRMGGAPSTDIRAVWEAVFLSPVYKAYVAGGSLPAVTPEDEEDMHEIFKRMIEIKSRHGWN